jgi:hypothetical protein
MQRLRLNVHSSTARVWEVPKGTAAQGPAAVHPYITTHRPLRRHEPFAARQRIDDRPYWKVHHFARTEGANESALVA